MKRTRLTVAALRALHGLTLTAGTVMTGWLLIAIVEALFFRGLPLRRAPEYLILYVAWLIVHLFIVWCAWCRFHECSFRASAISFSAWLSFFVWHGWFTEWAPFRIHEVLMPGYSGRQYMWISLQASLWVVGFAILPALRYSAHGTGGSRKR